MTGTFLLDGRVYFVIDSSTGIAQVHDVQGPVADFLTSKRVAWLRGGLDEDTKAKIFNIVDGLRRVNRHAAWGLLLPPVIVHAFARAVSGVSAKLRRS